jgi:large subunit ribosomal protein L23
MAIFSKRENTEDKKTVAPSSSSEKVLLVDYAHVLRNPRITEKATAHALMSAYVFDIAPNATKREIIYAIKELYKITPRKVTVSMIPRKAVRSARTGKKGVKSGGKKAYVYLKKGETITLS